MEWKNKFINKIMLGDCLDLLKEIPNNSIDLILTDPPYGMEFMGKGWDKAVPSVDIWKECIRVLKEGAFAFVMCIPRMDCMSRMIMNLENAGFKINFTPIFHAFASGFPKSSNISKLVDKKFGAEREVVGKDKHFGEAGCSIGIGGQEWDLKPNPSTPQAKALDGSYSGFQPKPSVELILVAMKPCSEKTYVEQALKNKKGITWLDDCRIPYESDDAPQNVKEHYSNAVTKITSDLRPDYGPNPQGRFPANLLVSDDVLNTGQVTKGDSRDYIKAGVVDKTLYDGGWKCKDTSCYPDTGSFSRYFSLDAWFSETIKKLPSDVRRTFPFLIVPKASSGEKERDLKKFKRQQKWLKGSGGTAISARENIKAKNIHPTCKPTKLMSYLIKLGSREGDLILDPFIGSGTTAISARQFNRKFIGFEKEEAYYKIALGRIKRHIEQKGISEYEEMETVEEDKVDEEMLSKEGVQKSIWDY